VPRSDKWYVFIFTKNSAPGWVISQTRDRLRRELEADEKEYEERLAAARKREEAQKKKFFARNVKRQVCYLSILSCAIVADCNMQQKLSSPEEAGSDEDDSFLPDDDEDDGVESGIW
jgi:chromosome transmission fidelity protein 1